MESSQRFRLVRPEELRFSRTLRRFACLGTLDIFSLVMGCSNWNSRLLVVCRGKGKVEVVSGTVEGRTLSNQRSTSQALLDLHGLEMVEQNREIRDWWARGVGPSAWANLRPSSQICHIERARTQKGKRLCIWHYWKSKRFLHFYKRNWR